MPIAAIMIQKWVRRYIAVKNVKGNNLKSNVCAYRNISKT